MVLYDGAVTKPLAMLELSDFSYLLPAELIAHSPLLQRDSSRLLHINRTTQKLSHHHFFDLPTLLQPGDVLVRNNTKVIPVKLVGHKPSGGKIEMILIKKDLSYEGEVWECLTKPGIKLDQEITFPQGVTAKCIKTEGYSRWLEFASFTPPFVTVLEGIGATPIPPYIHSSATEDELRHRYQTIYAKEAGSAAAPTAGLHFTSELDATLKEKGIELVEVTLHVGLGTFSPVREKDITQHLMHSEWYELTKETADTLNTAKQNGQRIISVGTTTTRVLETCAQKNENPSLPSFLQAHTGETSIYIYPPYQFKFIDGLITNFHLPESTLLMLVSALVTSPNTSLPFSSFKETLVGQAYQEAIKEKYRFFSFGDAMLIV